MKERVYALFGVVGPLVAYVFIGASILLSPWFSWERNALSDLGHAVKSPVAPIFNLGLLLAGFLTILYAVMSFKKHAKYTSINLVVSSILLQLVATFDEVYVFLHGTVSVLFFISISITSLVYAYERKSSLAAIAFIISLSSWILYALKIYAVGIAVPETISSVAVVSLFVYTAIKIYLGK